jgi:hypothetical protein
MYLQEILEVVVGLIFIWLVLSVATMSIQDWIANATNLRAKELQKAIAQMLGNKNFVRKFYEYPLIADLYTRPGKTSKQSRLPAYIPPNKFSSTLFELIRQAGVENSPVQTISDEIKKRILSIENPEQQILAKENWDIILETANAISGAGSGAAGLDSLKFQVEAFGEKYPELRSALQKLARQLDPYYDQFIDKQTSKTEMGSGSNLAMRQFHLGMLALQNGNPRLSESITAILRQAEGYTLQGEQAIATIRVNLETWFNDAMDRLSGDYTRKAHSIAFFISIFLALLFNIDSISVATRLWREPILRQAIMAQVQSSTLPDSFQINSTTDSPISIAPLETQLQALNIPFGWTTAAFDNRGVQCSILPFEPGRVWGIPTRDSHGVPICKRLGNLPVDPFAWFVKIIGILMTSAAAAQGAPFWFEILKKIVFVRGPGTPPTIQQPVG